MCCISHSFQFIHGKYVQIYYQYEGCQRGRHKLQQSYYADDIALLAGNEKEISELTSKINEVGKHCGMKINIKKTKAMVVSKKPNSPKINISIDGQQIEQVTSYMYLGRLITENGRSEKEIKRRILIARSIFNSVITLLSCLSRHKHEDQITSNKMPYLADTSLWSRDMDNCKIPVVQT